ncbi:hypothetical protein B0H16DRAFT_1611652, partial [Mycena metata]
VPHGPVFPFALGIVSILTPFCPPALPTLIHLHPSLPLRSLRCFASLHSRLVSSSPLATHPISFVHRDFHSFPSSALLFPQIAHTNRVRARSSHPSHLVPLRVQPAIHACSLSPSRLSII